MSNSVREQILEALKGTDSAHPKELPADINLYLPWNYGPYVLLAMRGYISDDGKGGHWLTEKGKNMVAGEKEKDHEDQPVALALKE